MKEFSLEELDLCRFICSEKFPESSKGEIDLYFNFEEFDNLLNRGHYYYIVEADDITKDFLQNRLKIDNTNFEDMIGNVYSIKGLDIKASVHCNDIRIGLFETVVAKIEQFTLARSGTKNERKYFIGYEIKTDF